MDVELAYRRYFPALRQHCRRLSGGAHWADDVAQEAFLRLLRGPRLATDRETLAWLYRISSNLAVDHLRRASRRPSATEDLAPPENATAERAAGLRHLVEKLSQLLAPQSLQAGLLTHASGLTQPELAEVLGVSERTARRRLADFSHAAERVTQERSP